MQADQPIALYGSGWRRGLGSLWRKEMGEWWSTRKWLLHLLIWTVVLNGLMILVSYASHMDPTETAPLLQIQLDLLLNLGAFATALGVTIQMQSSLIGERQSGTAAWILSKPVSRAAMIIAKFGANAVSFLSLSVLLPCTVGYAEIRLFGQAPSGVAYLGLVSVLLIHGLFYLCLTLMLGTLFSSRGPVLGTALALLFSSSLIRGMLPQVQWVSPFGLTSIAMGFFGFGPLPAGYPIPLAATLAWSLLFLAIAIRRFESEEL